MDRQQEQVLQTIEERDVRFVRLWFTDVIGSLKSVSIAPAELEEAFEEGVGFDGSAIGGLARVVESDMRAHPDASTFSLIDFEGEGEASARMFCDIRTRDGELARSHPRTVLKRALDRAEDLGLTFFTHPEIEFYLFHRSDDPHTDFQPIDRVGYFDHSIRSVAPKFRRQAIRELEAVGIPVEYSHHEGGPGQNEIDLRGADALTMADSIMTFRTVISHVAVREGISASFMPKPLIDAPGNGMHTHLSLFEGETNAFFDASGPYFLSRTARHFMAGLLAHSGEISAVTNQHVNSYKRLWAGDEAPSHIAWGHNNRSALIRIPQFNVSKPSSARIEYRAIDSSANPYLAYAVLLSAGLAGIAGKYELPEEAFDDVTVMTPNERKAFGIDPLPGNLEQALELMKESELVAETLGEDAFDFFIANKEQEWREYRNQVTPVERQRFLSLS